MLLEAHILDFKEDVYGQLIEVMFRKKIRDELKFDGIDALKTQIGIDVEEVRIFLVSSIFGGTGASGFPNIARRIKSIQQKLHPIAHSRKPISILPFLP